MTKNKLIQHAKKLLLGQDCVKCYYFTRIKAIECNSIIYVCILRKKDFKKNTLCERYREK